MKTSPQLSFVLGLILLVLFPVSGALGQDGQGQIEGQVTRETGAGISGVTVEIEETAATELTDGTGIYRFANVPEGTYRLTFTLGDSTASQSDVTVEAGSTQRVDMAVGWAALFAETITVSSVSLRPERIVDAPAAVTLVTEQEIARQASHGQLPKLLEFTPGAEATQSGIYDFNLNTRGFNSSLNRRVATLIDGRDPSVPFLGAQEWAAISFPLDDLSSLELVRGPSAALYGKNASSGVLNMVTRAPRYSEGGQIRLIGGELNTFNADLRWAGGLGSDWYVKFVGGVRDHGDFTVSRNGQAEYSVPCPVPQGAATDCLPQEAVPLNPLDDDEIFFGGLRFDKYLAGGSALTFEGGTASIEGPVFQTGIGRVQLVEVDRPWARFNFNADHWNLLTYYTKRDAPKQTALAAGTNLSLDTDRLAAELQTNWSFAEDKSRLVAGVFFMTEDIDSTDPATGRQTLLFAPVENDTQAAFAQFDWLIGERVRLVLAGRYDESDLHDSQFSPKGAVVFSINPNNTVRLTYNEAFQVANYSEFFLQANAAPPANLQPFEAFCAPFGVSCGFAPGPTRVLALGNATLDLEEIQAWEVGYSGILGGKAFLTIDYYNTDNERFIADLLPQLGTPLGQINPNFGPYTPPAALPPPAASGLLAALQGALGPSFFILSNNLDGTPILAAASYTNFGEVETQGVDLGLNYYADNWTISFAYSWFDFDIKGGPTGLGSILLPNSPENKAAGGIGYSAPRWDGNISARWVDDFRWAVGPFQGNVKSYTTVDLNGNYNVNDSWRVGLTVANLFDDEHWEAFGGDLLGRRALGHITFSW